MKTLILLLASCTLLSASQLTLQWDPVIPPNCVTDYNVYRAMPAPFGRLTWIKLGTSATLTFTASNLVPGSLCILTVRAHCALIDPFVQAESGFSNVVIRPAP